MLEAIICKSCGAPLTGSKCEYCGAVYRGFEEETVTFYSDKQPVLTASLYKAALDALKNYNSHYWSDNA